MVNCSQEQKERQRTTQNRIVRLFSERRLFLKTQQQPCDGNFNSGQCRTTLWLIFTT